MEEDREPSFPAGADSIPDQVFIVGVEINALTLPAATGGDGDLRHELTPTLPAGLSLDPGTRVISGAPTTVANREAYRWTATDADGDTAAIQFFITVEEDRAPSFPAGADSIPDQVFIVGVEINALTLPAATGGDGVLRHELTPALPAGLSLDPGTRVISGVPTTVANREAYRWTATDADGDTAAIQFFITVEEDRAPSFPAGAASIPDQVFIVGVEINALTLPAATGGDGVLRHELTPALPAGLSLDPGTRVISGVPTTVANREAYRWTAMDADGDTAAIQFFITVEEDRAPSFPAGAASIPDQVWVLQDPIDPLTLPAALGGNGEISYAIRPPLPDGVLLDGRRLSGIPSGDEHWGGTKRDYEWTATDADGDRAATTLRITLEGGVLHADLESRDLECFASRECEWSFRINRWDLSGATAETYAVEGFRTDQEVWDFLRERIPALSRQQQSPLLLRTLDEAAEEVLAPYLFLRNRRDLGNLRAGAWTTVRFDGAPRSDQHHGIWLLLIRFESEIFVGGNESAAKGRSGRLLQTMPSPPAKRRP